MAAIAGSIADPFYNDVPAKIVQSVQKKLAAELYTFIVGFSNKYYHLMRK
jgi:hypothetical protein